MKRRAALLFSILLFAIAGRSANAQPKGADCSNLVVNNTYVGVFEGYLNLKLFTGNPALSDVPTAGLQVVTFLPQGKLTGQVTIAASEVVKDAEQNGTYALSWDNTKSPLVCSGTATIVFKMDGNDTTETADIVVSQNGHRLEQIQKDVLTLQDIIVNTTSYRVETAGCGSHSLKGTYPYSVKGWTPMPDGQGPLMGFYPVAFTGAMEFDGNGHVVYSDTVSLNGTIFPRISQQGSYQIGSDCKGSMVLSALNSPDFHLELFVEKSGGTLYFVNTDADPTSGFPLFVVAGALEPDTANSPALR